MHETSFRFGKLRLSGQRNRRSVKNALKITESSVFSCDHKYSHEKLVQSYEALCN